MPNPCLCVSSYFNLTCIEILNQINISTLLRLSTPAFGAPAFVLEPVDTLLQSGKKSLFQN